jgi:hypothetical protein
MISFAPSTNVIYISAATAYKETTYDALIEAIFKVESTSNPFAYNALENAVGGLQIRQCRIEHYNRLTGKNYTLQEMYDLSKAKEVFLYFAKGKTYEQAAKNWNGSGPMTEIYWAKVKKLIAS